MHIYTYMRRTRESSAEGTLLISGFAPTMTHHFHWMTHDSVVISDNECITIKCHGTYIAQKSAFICPLFHIATRWPMLLETAQLDRTTYTLSVPNLRCTYCLLKTCIVAWEVLRSLVCLIILTHCTPWAHLCAYAYKIEKTTYLILTSNIKSPYKITYMYKKY